MESNHNLTITGNLFVEGGGTPVVSTLGTHQVNVNYTVPVQAQALNTSGGGGASAAQIAAEVLAALQQAVLPVNMVQVKGQVISGSGSEADPWGP